MNPHTGRDFVQFGKTESVLNKGAKKIALLFNPPPVLSLEIDLMHFQEKIQDNFFDFFDCSNLFQKVKSIKFGIIF